MVHCKKCHLYAVVHIVNLNNKKKKKTTQRFMVVFQLKNLNCNAYIINKCKGKEKKFKVLQALFQNSSMAEIISGLESKFKVLECDHGFNTPLRYCRFFFYFFFNDQHFRIHHIKIILKLCSVVVAYHLFLLGERHFCVISQKSQHEKKHKAKQWRCAFHDNASHVSTETKLALLN